MEYATLNSLPECTPSAEVRIKTELCRESIWQSPSHPRSCTLAKSSDEKVRNDNTSAFPGQSQTRAASLRALTQGTKKARRARRLALPWRRHSAIVASQKVR